MPDLDPRIPLGVQPPQPQASPLEMLSQIQSLRNLGQQSQLQQVQMKGEQQTQSLRDLQIAGLKREQAGRDALAAAIKAHTTANPQTGDLEIDHEGIARDVGGAGFTDQAESWLKTAASNAEALDKLKTTKRAHEIAQLETLGSMARNAASADDFLSSLGMAAAHGLIDEQTAHQVADQAQQAGPDGWKTIAAKYQQFDPKWVAEQEKLRNPVTLKEGEKLIIPGTGQTLASVPEKKAYQSKSVMLDGKAAEVRFDPATGRYLDEQGGDISARVKPIPPASVQINNATAAAAANAPLVDASRPVGAAANKIDPQTGITPNATYQNALIFGLEGKMPALGMGGSPQAKLRNNAIQNKAAAIAAAAGIDLPTVQAEYKANSGALNKLLPQAKATATAANTAIDNLDLARSQSASVSRTGSKLVNRYAQWAQGNLSAAKDLTKFETYVYTAAREYAKVTSGGAASAQGLTDSAAKEAEKLLNVAQSPEAFQAATEAMQADMANVLTNQTKTLSGISSTIANFFAAANGLPTGDAQPAAATTAKPGGASLTYQDYLKARGK